MILCIHDILLFSLVVFVSFLFGQRVLEKYLIQLCMNFFIKHNNNVLGMHLYKKVYIFFLVNLFSFLYTKNLEFVSKWRCQMLVSTHSVLKLYTILIIITQLQCGYQYNNITIDIFQFWKKFTILLNDFLYVKLGLKINNKNTPKYKSIFWQIFFTSHNLQNFLVNFEFQNYWHPRIYQGKSKIILQIIFLGGTSQQEKKFFQIFLLR
eukprot:TRINITY_DN14837_c0_g1_i1.p1 TRINITY_DN14837_c0_g1~~TRINITY_DN14837_c0_g1_i1.p1  ORF type:complete len:208 (-),score=-6.77 TRINITY_DN14837_c0_g1_i1:141-764(-)